MNRIQRDFLKPQFHRFVLLLQTYFVDHTTQIEEYNKFQYWFGVSMNENKHNHTKVLSDANLLLETYMKGKGQKIIN